MTSFKDRIAKYREVMVYEYVITERQYDLESALWRLFLANEEKLSLVWDNYGEEDFHKTFRQIDPTECGDTDMAIHHLIYASKLWNRTDLMEMDS